MNPYAIAWSFRLEGEDKATRLPLARVVDLAVRADRWRKVYAWRNKVKVSFELGAGETLPDVIEATLQDMATEAPMFETEAEAKLARAALNNIARELERPSR